VVSEDPRVDRLLRRIAGPLDPVATRAAEERVWRAVRAGRARRRGGWVAAVATLAAALVLLLAGAWLASYRFEVASGGTPILYREEVARTAIRSEQRGAARAADGTLAIAQGHFSASEPGRLVVVAIADVRVASDALPATFEIRYREAGSAVSGVLARTADLSEARRATADVRYSVAAPFPPLERGDVRTYDIWLHVDTAGGAIESAVLNVEVRGAPEGQRARLTVER
jgi:hypothetical protein